MGLRKYFITFESSVLNRLYISELPIINRELIHSQGKCNNGAYKSQAGIEFVSDIMLK
jgi:hypothetical protein